MYFSVCPFNLYIKYPSVTLFPFLSTTTVVIVISSPLVIVVGFILISVIFVSIGFTSIVIVLLAAVSKA